LKEFVNIVNEGSPVGASGRQVKIYSGVGKYYFKNNFDVLVYKIGMLGKLNKQLY
jgi:hypothetical protein